MQKRALRGRIGCVWVCGWTFIPYVRVWGMCVKLKVCEPGLGLYVFLYALIMFTGNFVPTFVSYTLSGVCGCVAVDHTLICAVSAWLN